MTTEKGSSNQSRRSYSKPSWLLSTLADVDDKMKVMALNVPEEDDADTFGERAESYYRKRPQLLALLQDLHNDYLSLADRYCQTLAKHHHRKRSSQIPPLHLDYEEEEEDGVGGGASLVDSDAESSLSYQPPPVPTQTKPDGDAIIAELVMKSVDCDVLLNEISIMERRCNESSRKIELQKSLLEVLESERLILLNENARLGYRVTALVEENKGLASESAFMKRKAGELAGCVLKMREDHRVCMLSRKIEDLQGQIYGLEKRNKEYYQQLVKRDEEDDEERNKSINDIINYKKKKSKKKKSVKNGGEVTLEDCFEVGEAGSGGGGGWRVSKLWNRVKNFDVFLCGPHDHHPNSTTCC